MNILKSGALLVVVMTALCVTADAPVAVRVDVNSVDVGPTGTRVALTVQISPEDRSRIGKNAMVRVLLDGAVPLGQSPLWAVRIEDNGSAVIDTVWPPGDHDLQVEISSPNGEHSGLWVGTVRIPGTRSEIPDEDAEKSAPEPAGTAPEAKDSAAGAKPAAAGGSGKQTGLGEPTEITEAPQKASAEMPEKGTDTGPEIESSSRPPEEPEVPMTNETKPGTEAQSMPPQEESVPEGSAGSTVQGGEHDGAEAYAGSEVADTIDGAPAEAAAPPGNSAGAEPEATSIAPKEAVVEPLRSDKPQQGAPDEEAIAGATEVPAESPAPPSDEEVAAFEAWSRADPGSADLTVIVLRDDEPANGLKSSDFELEIAGRKVQIEAVGDRGRAPLQLGVAVDVAAGQSAGWLQPGGRLDELVRRVRAGGDHLFIADDGRIGRWDESPGSSPGDSESVSGADLTSLISASLGRFEGRRGRTFLVVVTDGRSDADKSAWKATTETAANAGIPVLVIALWDSDFDQRVRKNLKTIADSSGGALFLVQGTDQLDRAAERFGPILDAGVAIRFALPAGLQTPASVRVTSQDKGLEVTAPQRFR